MKKFLPLIVFFAFVAASGYCQSKKYFAVTGDKYGSTNWIEFRQFDLDDITNAKTLYVPAEQDEAVYDAQTSTPLLKSADAVKPASPQACGCMNNRMVAAIAYDALNNRLYYTNMLGNQLRYLDLSSDKPKSYAVTAQPLKNFPNQPGEASVITRMCFAANGFGYALTNDNQHLMQFSTKRNDITDLGNLIDAKTNGTNSVKTQFKSWGGDLIADANGALYLFAMQRGVFKINPATRIATYLGDIQNIPSDYTINAAMVEDDAQVIVASSTNTSTYYRVDLTTLQATAVANNAKQVYNVSDFANANLAFGKKDEAVSNPKKHDNKIAVNIYPNPVTAHNFTLQLSNFKKDKYIIQVNQAEGKTILQNNLSISGSQTQRIILPSSLAGGAYVVKVINSKGENVYESKIIVAQ